MTSPPIPKRDWRWLEHVPSLFLSIAGVAVVVIDIFFHNEVSSTALYTQFPDYMQILFVGLMVIGAIFCAYGVFTKTTRAEGGGIILIGSAYLIDSLAIFSLGGGAFSGALIAAAGLYLWFQAFILFPVRDYPEGPEAPVISLQDYESRVGIPGKKDDSKPF